MGNAVIFVLGMGRSGTSAITRVLGLCGGALPEKLLGPNDGNPRGHWEPLDALNLNEEFLSQHGSSWYDPTLRLQRNPVPEQQRVLFVQRIRQFLEQSVSSKPLVIKEPRITALTEYWFQAATGAGLTVKIVIPVRHPNEVAASLIARDKISIELASTLYLKYSLLGERESRRYPRVFVGYRNLLDDWRREIARVSESLSLDLAAGDGKDVEAFLSRALNRQRDSGEPPDWIFGANWMSGMNRILSAAANGATCDCDTLDQIYSAFSRLEATFVGEAVSTA